MKTLALTIMMLFVFVASQAQLITFNALKNGVIDVAEIKKELILSGFTRVTDSSEDQKDTYAYRYDEEKQSAAIWVKVETMFTNDSVAQSFGASTGWCTISMQSFGHEIHEYLTKEIVQYCTFQGIRFDDALEYSFKSKADFYISSEDGTNYIEASPPSETLLKIMEPYMEQFLQEMLDSLQEAEGLNNIEQ